MSHLVAGGDIVTLETELSELGTSSSPTSVEQNTYDEHAEKWAELNRLPSFERLRSSLVDDHDDTKGKRIVDVSAISASERHIFIEKLIKHIENDNLRLLQKLRKRINKVGLKFPTVDVRYNNLRVEAECRVVRGKPLPTIWNSLQSLIFNIAELGGLKSRKAKICILHEVSGIIKPGSKLVTAFQYITYQLLRLLFVPELMTEVSRREKEAGVIPDPDIDTFMKAISIEGKSASLQTDYILKVISKKDQAQYWHRTGQTHRYVSVDRLSQMFKESTLGKTLDDEISKDFLESENHDKSISHSLLIIASITMTAFLRTRMEVDAGHANEYLGSLFYSLIILLVDGFPELSMTVARLPVFYKQRELCFYPAWAYAIPAAILKIPLSILESLIWVSLTYYAIGYSPEPERFFRQLILFFAVHLMSISMFRFLASVCRTTAAATLAGSMAVPLGLLFGGFIIPRPSMPSLLKLGFWVSPVTYGQIGLAVNEFHGPRWQKMLSTNTTIGHQTLVDRGMDFSEHFYWISLGSLFGFTLIFNVGFILALSYLKAPGSRAIISREKLSEIQGSEEIMNAECINRRSNANGRMVLPFEPVSFVFQDVQYYVETPLEMIEHGTSQKKLQLLCNITGAFRPGVLTALMGVSGAGKTTLLDVLAGRKTSGTITGEMKIGGYPKVQETFARISGYCEQSDIHSPQVTVEESVIFSAWLRLHPQIDSKTKYDFVKDVLETVELDGIKDSLVGMPGVSGLSTEQRKRLTIVVELVSNPSIIFMDEPTTGLDARAAAIVMRAVKNVADTGRTIVCTIHQPSIDIFEAFDEVGFNFPLLILLKSGGRVIYSGPLGLHSSKITDYFESISGVPKIKNNYNPATWMLEVTSTSAEAELGLDFAQIYEGSALHEKFHHDLEPTQAHVGIRECNSLLQDNQQNVFSMFGLMFTACTFIGINNASTVLPYISTERNVLYRERFAGMYAPWAYALAQVTIEVPYLFTQSVAYVIITYPMIGYSWTAYKVFWYFYSMFCTLLYYNYMGMMVVSITPTYPVAAILQSSIYTMFSLFSGFIIPQPRIPKWWLWFYYLIPTSWTLNAMLSSQYGDVDEEIMVFGEKKTVAAFLKDYFGFHHDRLPMVGVVLMLYPIIFASIFTYCIGKLNFQRR
uniref:ABC transporter domain-containing protein n=1 Tax=Daucus carota subsp. sativus TaxID=79200 RepID=A0A166B526_DAUCS